MPAANIKQPPSSWCPEVCELFVPIRCLGVGGFGAVWLATRKTPVSNISSTVEYAVPPPSSPSSSPSEVAIKVVGHAHNQTISSFEQMSEAGYFKREISILQEISHPRIIRCLQVIEADKRSESSCAPYCMVLEYCRGPTVEQLLKYGGAFGLSLAQEVSSQLIDAVSYLHGHAVIHRDIKPDNIIVNGARLSDEDTWSDDLDGNDAAQKMKWNIKLIDFGFARALRPDDIEDENNYTLKTKKEDTIGFLFGTVDNQLDDASMRGSSYSGVTTKNKKKGNKKTDNDNNPIDLSHHSQASISKIPVRALSAVGNRMYAAPEITNGVRIFKKRGAGKNKNNQGGNQQEPLTECVSDYGMIVDAFSTGATIRYMCLGIPPQTSVEDFWREKNSLLRVVGRKVKKAITKKDTGTTKKRKKKYRADNDLPTEAVRLILGMTHWNAKKRTSVRSARSYDWIASSYSMKNSNSSSSSEEHDTSPLSEDHGAKLDFLKCAMEEQEQK